MCSLWRYRGIVANHNSQLAHLPLVSLQVPQMSRYRTIRGRIARILADYTVAIVKVVEQHVSW